MFCVWRMFCHNRCFEAHGHFLTWTFYQRMLYNHGRLVTTDVLLLDVLYVRTFWDSHLVNGHFIATDILSPDILLGHHQQYPWNECAWTIGTNYPILQAPVSRDTWYFPSYNQSVSIKTGCRRWLPVDQGKEYHLHTQETKPACTWSLQTPQYSRGTMQDTLKDPS